NRVVVELSHPIAEPLAVAPCGRRVESAELVRDRAAAVRDQDLEVGKVVEHGRVDEPVRGRRLLVDEVERIGLALGLSGPARMNVRDDVELAELLVERIPIAVAERRGLHAAVLVRIGIENAALEAELLHAALELR